MCNVFGDPATVRHKLRVLAQHCEAVGRDPKTIVKTRLGSLLIRETLAEAERTLAAMNARTGRDLTSLFIAGDPESVSEQVQAYLDAGLDGMIFNMPYLEGREHIELAGRTLARIPQPAQAAFTGASNLP